MRAPDVISEEMHRAEPRTHATMHARLSVTILVTGERSALNIGVFTCCFTININVSALPFNKAGGFTILHHVEPLSCISCDPLNVGEDPLDWLPAITRMDVHAPAMGFISTG